MAAMKSLLHFVRSYIVASLVRFHIMTRRFKRNPIVRPFRRFAFWTALQLSPIGGAADSSNSQIGKTLAISYYGDVESPTQTAYIALGQVRSIDGVGVDLPEVDSTTLESTQAEYIAGLKTGQEVTIRVAFGSANDILFERWCRTGDPVTFKLAFGAPASITRYIVATPRGFGWPATTAPNLIEQDFKCRITSGPTDTDPQA